MKVIGRKPQLKTIHEILKGGQSSLIAITGRRRVGKTFLIDQSMKPYIVFRMTGIQNGSMKEQLMHFIDKLKEYSGAPFLSTPTNWLEAFSVLKRYLESLGKDKKKVIFFDEVPWIHTARSGFLEKLAHLWNDFISKEENYHVVLCGSASSWINRKVIIFIPKDSIRSKTNSFNSNRRTLSFFYLLQIIRYSTHYHVDL